MSGVRCTCGHLCCCPDGDLHPTSPAPAGGRREQDRCEDGPLQAFHAGHGLGALLCPHVPPGQQAWMVLGPPVAPIVGCRRVPAHISAWWLWSWLGDGQVGFILGSEQRLPAEAVGYSPGFLKLAHPRHQAGRGRGMARQFQPAAYTLRLIQEPTYLSLKNAQVLSPPLSPPLPLSPALSVCHLYHHRLLDVTCTPASSFPPCTCVCHTSQTHRHSVCTSIHAHKHMGTHAHNTRLHTCNAHMHTHTWTHANTHRHANTCNTCAHKHVYAEHMHTCTNTHACKHVCTDLCTHASTRAHTHHTRLRAQPFASCPVRLAWSL